MVTESKLSAEVARIKHDHRQHVSANFPAPGICVSRCSGRWPCQAYRAAAALAEVLRAIRTPSDLEGRGLPGDGQAVRRAVRAAITSALTGEGKTGD